MTSSFFKFSTVCKALIYLALILPSMVSFGQCIEIEYHTYDRDFDHKKLSELDLPIGFEIEDVIISLKSSLRFSPRYASYQLDSFRVGSDVGENSELFVTARRILVDGIKNKVYYRTEYQIEGIIAEKALESDFKIGNEFKTVLGLKCRSAIANRKNGKQMKLWFSEDDLPYPYGPGIKFMGLPGLVLEIEVDGKTSVVATNIHVLDKEECDFTEELKECTALKGVPYVDHSLWSDRSAARNSNHTINHETVPLVWLPISLKF